MGERCPVVAQAQFEALLLREAAGSARRDPATEKRLSALARPTFLVLLLALLPLVVPRTAAAQDTSTSAVHTRPVAFTVRNPLEPLWTRTMRGTLYEPATQLGCNRSVVVLLHGLSYARWAWDFPLEPETYSLARALAARGYPVVAVDALGYGSSDKPNGWNLTVETYGELTAQVVAQLRSGRYRSEAPVAYQHLALVGHSAGTEMAELAAGLHGNVDALVATAYTHFPSAGILLDVLAGDTPRALLSDYVYFGGTPERRKGYMYALDVADPDVVALDTQMAQQTPSGQILTINAQPSRSALPLITAPVLLVLAERDVLFPPSLLLEGDLAAAELALFVGSADKTVHVVPDAGHSFMLHPNAPAVHQLLGDWLGAGRLPACGVP